MRERVALVTGGNRGIGLEICRQLGQRGITVVLGSRDMEKGEAAAAEDDGPHGGYFRDRRPIAW